MLVDLQRDYLDTPGIEPAAGSIVDRSQRLLEQCRELGVPVAHVRTTVTREPDNRMTHWKHANRWICEAGAAGHAPPASLAARTGDVVISKTAFSAFAGTDAFRVLRERQIDAVILAGVHLHACVRQTALDAYQAGLNVWIASDAVGSDDPVHAAITRRYLEARSIEFLPVEPLLKRLARSIDAHGDANIDDGTPIDSVETAVSAAHKLAPVWRLTSGAHRVALVRQFQRQIAERQGELTDLVTAEISKPVRHSRGEVARTLEMIDAVVSRALAAGDEQAAGSTVLRRRPHGVVAVISPFNNPLYLPLGKILPAVLYGNVVAWKPAPEAHRTAARLVELMVSAGWPTGLVALVEGDRREGQALLADGRVQAATITGSLAAGVSAQEICARRRIPLQAELGGNNPAIVWVDANLDEAARQIAAGAFDLAGQRCTANRRVIVHHACRDRFLELLVAASKDRSWGDPRLESTDIGPLATPAHARRVKAMVERAIDEGATPLYPLGEQPPDGDDFADAWRPPTILACNDPAHEIVQEEAFGPVLVMQTARDWPHAMRLVNGVKQGLAAAIFTASRETADAFLAEAQAGILKINRSTADAAVDAPFGGWKASGIGPPEHGVFDLEFFTRPQTIYGILAEKQ